MSEFPFDGHAVANWCPPEGASPPEWKPSAQGHLDGYGSNGWIGGFNHGLAVCTYLVGGAVERSGCFTYWPGSHHHTHQFFIENPELIDGSEWRPFPVPCMTRRLALTREPLALWYPAALTRVTPPAQQVTMAQSVDASSGRSSGQPSLTRRSATARHARLRRACSLWRRRGTLPSGMAGQWRVAPTPAYCSAVAAGRPTSPAGGRSAFSPR